jgi:hypothetical protein
LFSNNLDPSTVSRFACLITRKVCQWRVDPNFILNQGCLNVHWQFCQ